MDYCRQFNLFAKAKRQFKNPCLSWGLHQWEDPGQDARSVAPHWDVPTNAQILKRRTPGEAAPAFDVWKIPGEKTLCHLGSHMSLTARCKDRVARLQLSVDLQSGTPFAVSIGSGRGFATRAKAARAFLGSLEAKSPSYWAESASRPTLTAITHMPTLRALDGVAAGASQRDIARHLFGGPSFTWHDESPWRSRVRYLLKCGRERCEHGYLRMAGLAREDADSVRQHAAARTRMKSSVELLGAGCPSASSTGS